jgi:hypothetical protein
MRVQTGSRSGTEGWRAPSGLGWATRAGRRWMSQSLRDLLRGSSRSVTVSSAHLTDVPRRGPPGTDRRSQRRPAAECVRSDSMEDQGGSRRGAAGSGLDVDDFDRRYSGHQVAGARSRLRTSKRAVRLRDLVSGGFPRAASHRKSSATVRAVAGTTEVRPIDSSSGVTPRSSPCRRRLHPGLLPPGWRSEPVVASRRPTGGSHGRTQTREIESPWARVSPRMRQAR